MSSATTIPEDVLQRARAMLDRRFTLWHRPRGKRKWIPIGGIYPDVLEAMCEMDAQQARGVTGNFKAIKVGISPEAD